MTEFSAVASVDFEAGGSVVTTLAPTVSITSTSGEVIRGSRSLKLEGSGAYAQIVPEAVGIQPGRFYTIELQYRMLRAGRVGVLLRIPGGTPEFTMLGELPATATSAPAAWSMSVQTPAAPGATLLFYALGATVTIDDIQVLAQRSQLRRASVPRLVAGFPRIGGYLLTSPAHLASLNGTDPDEAERVAGNYDLIAGAGFDHTQGAAAWIRRLRRQNPSLLMLPYQQAFMAQYESPIGLQAEFNAGLPASWFMVNAAGQRMAEPAFPQNVQLDHTAYAPTQGGLTLADYHAGFLAKKVLPSGLWDGILFDQAEWYTNPLLGEHTASIDLNRDRIADDAGVVQRAWADGFHTHFRAMTRQFGFTQLLLGNNGYLAGHPTALATLNGWVAEHATPYAIGADGDWDTRGASDWYRLFGNYLASGRLGRAPQVPLLQFSGAGLGSADSRLTPNGVSMRGTTLDGRDYRRMRLGLTTTLLGDGFFGYTLVDNTTPPLWFDEYAVDGTGTATGSATGKGYLGQPLGDATELTFTSTTRLHLTFEAGTTVPAGVYVNGRTSSAASEAISGTSLIVTKTGADDFAWFLWGAGLTVPGRTYQLEADYRVLSASPVTYRGIVGLGLADATAQLTTPRMGSLFMPDVDGAGQAGRLRASFKASATNESVLGMLFDAGTVAIDNLRLVEGSGGAWRRDFENGVVIVNPTPDALTLSQAQVIGPLARSGVRRIRGAQAADWNTGAAVTAGLTIPSGDGIILLANRVAPAALPAPAAVRADVSATSARVSWSPVAGYPASYLLEYGEDAQGLTRVAAAGRAAAVTIDDLRPGSTYFVRVAAVDYRGVAGPFSTNQSLSVPGTSATRPVFTVATGALVPGALVTVAGSGLADSTVQFASPYPVAGGNTRVEVNGVPVPLYSISPGTIVFIAPWELAGSAAVVNVVRGGTPGIERLTPLSSANPFLFADTGSTAYALHANGRRVTVADPARAGEEIDLFATGLGTVSVAPDNGVAPPAGWQASAVTLPAVTINGVAATTRSATLEPGLIALYRIKVTVPAGSAGTPAVTVSSGGRVSNQLTLPVN